MTDHHTIGEDNRMIDPALEWLETSGLGGFAMGTVIGERTRRYHGLLLIDRQQQRTMLVNGLEVWAQTSSGTYPLSTHVYDGGHRFPEGQHFVTRFSLHPCPKWEYVLGDETVLNQEVLIPHGSETVMIRWSLPGDVPVRLHVRPLISVRDYHSLHQENTLFDFRELSHVLDEKGVTTVAWRPYANQASVIASFRGAYEPQAKWFRRFYYEIERQRGLDFLEDLASPGEFHGEIRADAPLTLTLRADSSSFGAVTRATLEDDQAIWDCEIVRRQAMTPLKFAASQYIACRDGRDTIIAGYPWFTDWGRDTFIALRGFCLAGGELELAKKILLAWSETVSEGMLPNRFPDGEQTPEYNSVDASLWFVIAAFEWMAMASAVPGMATRDEEKRLLSAISEILRGYRSGTRHAIRMDRDGLIAAGEPGVQLTWMDARIGDWIATPRIGKPVEIQCLWLNCLYLAGLRKSKWREIFEAALPTFRKRFWNETTGGLHDIIDANHAAGTVDASFRPNQVFAVGGLPYGLIEGKRARSIVDNVESRLWTPSGLRTLDPQDPQYIGKYAGNVFARDAAYHQGTVWPWLLGPFVDAWVRVRGGDATVMEEAQKRFLAPIERLMKTGGLGHVTEVASGDPPHEPGGCPFQAWSLSEYMRVNKMMHRRKR